MNWVYHWNVPLLFAVGRNPELVPPGPGLIELLGALTQRRRLIVVRRPHVSVAPPADLSEDKACREVLRLVNKDPSQALDPDALLYLTGELVRRHRGAKPSLPLDHQKRTTPLAKFQVRALTQWLNGHSSNPYAIEYPALYKAFVLKAERALKKRIKKLERTPPTPKPWWRLFFGGDA